MQRDPSLHCKLSDLISCLESLQQSGVIIVNDGFSIDCIAYDILSTLHEKAPNYRFITTKKVSKKAEKGLEIDSSLVESLNLMIYTKKLNLKHKNVKLLTFRDKEYSLLLSVTQKAIDFCDIFYNSDYSKGFNVYINYACDILGPKFSLKRIPQVHDAIVEIAEIVVYINTSPVKSLADEVYIYYTSKVRKHTHTYELDFTTPSDFIHFVKTAELISRYKATPSEWIDAIFDCLFWTGRVPFPRELHSKTAPQYYMNRKNNSKK